MHKSENPSEKDLNLLADRGNIRHTSEEEITCGNQFLVKDVNTALSYAQRKSVPMYQKSDSYDAEAVALVLINLLDKLPDAVQDDKYWTLSQLVNRRDNINIHQQRLKNQLHEQLCMAYPSYKKFF